MHKTVLERIWLLLEPSWLSGLLSVVASIGTVVGTIFISSDLHKELLEAKLSGDSSIHFDTQTVTNNLAQNAFVSNLPLFLFWAGLGVVVYLFAVSLWGGLGEAEEIREELGYVNAPKNQLARTIVVHLVLRLVALGAWLVYLQAFLKILLPYGIAATRIATSSFPSFDSIGYLLLALSVFFVSMQIHALFLRLIFLRFRIFGGLYD